MLSSFRLAILITVVGLGQARAFELTSSSLLAPGSPATWQGWDGSDWEVYSTDGLTTSQLTNNDSDDTHPQRSGSIVVWQGWDGNDWEIYHFESNILNQLTDNNFDDIAAHFSGANVQWQGWDGEDWEIFQFDNVKTSQLTDNRIDDFVLFASNLGAGSNGSAGSSSTPEPSAFALLCLSLFGLASCGWRRQNRR
jgi:hypothetical protein